MRGKNLVVWPAGAPFDFELLKGEVVGVVGLDGQGQSEFVKTLAGVQPPLSGFVEVFKPDGKSELIDGLSAASDSKVTYVSGDRKREGIFASLSIFENMVMPLYRQRTHGGKLGIIDWTALATAFRRGAENLLIKYGDKGDRITSLSGGNQQKVLIGRGFAMRPNIMVLNDPARGIDVGAKSELYKHLRAFAVSGKSVVYMSSELEEFMGFATRVIVFRHGSPFASFDGETLDGRCILEAMFGQKGAGTLQHKKPEMFPSEEETPRPPIRLVESPVPVPERRHIRVVEYGQNGEVVSRSAR
ncbi:ATP-binding cassette domain-containing protein [Aestuariivirga sp.]|uniref:ATP-binding cassette domain-containing protein n=1 Tax=Aestuariivirga sp. TaxID=2650926 RepID=UPI0039E67026